MPTKVKELDNSKDGDKNACPICNPNPKRVREDQIWGNCPTNRKHEAHK